MDIDDLLYVFLIVGSIIASIVKGAQKSKGRKNNLPDIFEEDLFKPENESPSGRYDDPFQQEAELTPSQQKYSEQQPDPFTYDPFEVPDYTNYDQEYQDEYSKEAVSYEDQIKAHEEETRKKKEEAKKYEEMASKIELGENEESVGDFDFDPVKAIIYSEILKRPEY